jgi:hypothetical protein
MGGKVSSATYQPVVTAGSPLCLSLPLHKVQVVIDPILRTDVMLIRVTNDMPDTQ